ncbi:aminotransferase class I/II-fold pyridoxal phosphate-dependent enzyme [Streptomyces sp. NPDC048269]|uniref:aminotransferase class I/II-fold pyridoxal phosphate-dependent enzyme n=1 Tax=Streptomyces sp. NPDC048269 TaxID=3155753 RepID=UPI0034246F61
MNLSKALCTTLDTVDRWRKEDCYPFFPVITEAASTVARLHLPTAGPDQTDRQVTVLSSADYLGFAHHPEVTGAAVEALHRFGTVTYGTQAVGGFTSLHRDLEQTVAEFFDRPAALLCATGMQANLAVLGSLFRPGDTVISDRFNHGSITMGARLSGATVHTSRHNDTDHVAQLLATAPSTGQRVIVVDGLFSAHGDLAPLPELADLAERYDALLMVDEAHSAGALGAHGRGAAEHLGVLERVDLITGTFSKAFGSTGGFVCAGERVIDALRHSSAPYALSLGLPPATVGAALAAMRLARHEGTDRRGRLAHNARLLHHHLDQAGVDRAQSTEHVVIVPIGGVDRTARVARRLLGDGLLTSPLFPPAVPIGGGRLRMGVTAAHHAQDLADAAQLIATALATTA